MPSDEAYFWFCGLANTLSSDEQPESAPSATVSTEAGSEREVAPLPASTPDADPSATV